MNHITYNVNSIILKKTVNHHIFVMFVTFLLMSAINFPALSADTSVDESFFLNQIFTKYGNSYEMDMHGFEILLNNIGLGHLITKSKHGETMGEIEHIHHSHQQGSKTTHNKSEPDFETEAQNIGPTLSRDKSVIVLPNQNQCLSLKQIMQSLSINTSTVVVNKSQFTKLCPALVYELDTQACKDLHSEFHSDETASHLVWIYAAASVLVISLSGLLVVAVIPIIRGAFYELLLQFLVALAVGSLIGDALLHLLPHALSGDDHHDCHGDHNHGGSKCVAVAQHLDSMVWKGLVGVLGIFLFFIAERILTFCSTRRKKISTPIPAETLLDDDMEMKKSVGEKLCKHKYNSYNYCYGEVTIDMLKGLNECEDKDHHNCLEKASQTELEIKDPLKAQLDDEKMLNPLRSIRGEGDHFDDVETRSNNGVIITQHEHRHHGHSHMHTHSVPTTISSVAWMVVMGDGLHNFSDGLAIGAAFSNSITGGVSTSIAVFCHELPHELGDFAVLLRSGMTAKQALAYNGLSSVLCFLGMLFGVALGNLVSISAWIFAGAAGMFIYIALVDMIPELNSSPGSSRSSENLQILIQSLGMGLGVGIMLLIALYEHDLQRLFITND